MQWTVRYYLNESRTWKDRSLYPTNCPGATAYAARQMAIWQGRAVAADREFGLANPDHVTLIT